MVNRLFVGIIYGLLLLPAPGMAQRTVGIDWQVPSDASEAKEDLQYFSNLGVTHLQVHQPLDPQIWQHINRLEFTVWGKLPINFAVTQTFTKADSSFTAEMKTLTKHFASRQSVHAIGIYSVGADFDEDFIEAVSAFIKKMDPAGKPFYFVTVNKNPSRMDTLLKYSLLLSPAGETPHQFKGYFYRPASDQKWSLANTKAFIRSTEQQYHAPIFFHSSWLQEMVKKHPDFATTLQLYATSAEPAFPLPQTKVNAVDSNTIIVVMLLLAWLTFSAVYSYNPVYRKSFMRYFTGHKFFVDDVMQRHIRELFTGLLILIQHAMAGGIVVYCLFHIFFSPLGYEALATHYPILVVFGNSNMGIFVWGFLLTLAVETLNITWLWGVNPGIKHLSQILNLYPWLLQLNLVIATLIAAFYLAGENNIPVFLLTALFLLLFGTSFFITAADTIRPVKKKQGWLYAGTIGIFILITAGIILWLVFSPELQNVVQLAARLPK